ncbi:MAG: cell division protein FtsZ [Lachnospirales bacterium]
MLKSEIVIEDVNKSAIMPKIAIIGIGGAGNNAVNHMINRGMEFVDFMVVNTDNQDLFASKVDKKIQIGMDSSKGLGAGGNPEAGKIAAEESRSEIAAALEGYDMVFLTAGMGGGTGTGATPVVAKIAKEMGILTVAVVTRPFVFEGMRPKRAIEGIENLKKNVDSIIIIPNDKILEIVDDETEDVDALKKTDEILFLGVSGITSIIFKNGTINLDFNDLRKVLGDSGLAYMGVGEGSGSKGVETALKMAINNPLVDETIIGGNCAMVAIHSAKSTMKAASKVFTDFRKYLDDEPEIFNGLYKDESLGDKVLVTTIVTGVGKERIARQEKEQEELEDEELYEDSILNTNNSIEFGSTGEVPIVGEAKSGTSSNNKGLPPITKNTINIPPIFNKR